MTNFFQPGERGARFYIGLFCLAAWVAAMVESSSRRSGIFEGAGAKTAPSPPVERPTLRTRVSSGTLAPSVHAPSAVELPDGGIRAFWFAGEREGAPDVAIWSADFDGTGWSPPKEVVDRELVARGTRRYLRKLGNPVAHVDAEGQIILIVVSVSFGGWSGSAINRIVFDGEAPSVLSVNRLVATPVMNLGTLVRGAAFTGIDGTLLLPAYHESLKKFPQLLHLDLEGRVLSREGPAVRGNVFQPWKLAAWDGGEAEIFLRRGAGKEEKVFYSRRVGEGWSDPVAIPVPNPNAGISAARLADGTLILAANPHVESRSGLVLLRASDPSGPWETAFVVESEERGEEEGDFQKLEYSYPWLLIDKEGSVNLFYTWNRKEIRHLRLAQNSLRGKGGAR